jgi:phage terminase large subunit
LAQQIGSPGHHINRANKLVIEAKQEMQKRGLASPDDADALALTFARAVAPVVPVESSSSLDD